MKKEKEEQVICIYDENGSSITEVILEAFERYLRTKLTKVDKNKKGND